MSLKKLVDWRDWGDSVSIMANTGIQIFDFQLNIEHTKKYRAFFAEKKNDTVEKLDAIRELELLHTSLNGEPPNSDGVDSAITYEVNALESIEPFIDNWIPVPFFRVAAGKVSVACDIGPTTWSRMRISKIDTAEDLDPKTPSFRIQIAFDTTISASDEKYCYLQPNDKDVTTTSQFRLATEIKTLSQFINGKANSSHLSSAESDEDSMWVTDWVKAIFRRFLDQRNDRGRPLHRAISDFSRLEHLARFIAMLHLIDKALTIPEIKILPSPYLNEKTHAIDVDLILDIGNSRTCGLLIEQATDGISVDLNNVVQLELRDLSSPQFSYDGLFQSRVVFSDHDFGDERLARASGRNNSFIWPSFVRFGPEASKLVQSDQGNEGLSGLSSPKRYLWDNQPRENPWRFHQQRDIDSLPASLNAAIVNLTQQGDHIKQIGEDVLDKIRPMEDQENAVGAITPSFSKSSLYGFMVAEIIAHAFVQINDPSYRINGVQKDTPRRLKRVILTLPTATPSQEQAIVKSKVNGALKMVWDRLAHWGQKTEKNQPELKIDWDEASCTQVVYLYSEIMAKYEGRLAPYLNIFGKLRKDPKNEDKKSVKIACIDIGGGTTDLMVTTYYQRSQESLVPNQEFREGFRVAGDDLIAEVISSVIIPKLKASATGVQENEIDAIFHKLFARNVSGVNSTRKQLRRQFGLRVLNPIALALVEKSMECLPETNINVSEIFNSGNVDKPPIRLLNYLNEEVISAGAIDWSIMDQSLKFSHKEISQVFERLFRVLLDNISEVVQKLNVDTVLLTGAPSRHPLVRNMLVNSCIAPPNRIIAMHDYHTGAWYPFRNSVNKVGDPKSTVAVGAMLIAMSDKHIQNFNIPTEKFRMKSTAKYIGRMELGGQILNDNILFTPAKIAAGTYATQEIYSPVSIGSRQLNLERWKTSHLYQLAFTKGAPTGSTPYTVEIKSRDTLGAAGAIGALTAQALKESFEIVEILDSEDRRVPNTECNLSLQTLGEDGEYWLETGEFLR